MLDVKTEENVTKKGKTESAFNIFQYTAQNSWK